MNPEFVRPFLPFFRPYKLLLPLGNVISFSAGFFSYVAKVLKDILLEKSQRLVKSVFSSVM